MALWFVNNAYAGDHEAGTGDFFICIKCGKRRLAGRVVGVLDVYDHKTGQKRRYALDAVCTACDKEHE